MSQALIIIDLIEDIIGEQGLSNSSAAETKARDIINKSNKAAQYARAHQIPVIWVKVGFSDDYHDIPAGSPMFKNTQKLGALKLSGSGCRWVKELDVQPQDHIFIKKGVSAFTSNKLDQWLKQHNSQHLVISGVSSLMAIQSTARLAHDLGYQVTVLEDLCAAANAELHMQSMQALQGMATISCSTEWQQS
ncbi:cysteine hydrolase [Moellerella wisconsensis]|uniref:cysteine hydrolase family protein n=1 Tax=Moellerella wisconsensis TaxID=158849 RepID=UPI0030767244